MIALAFAAAGLVIVSLTVMLLQETHRSLILRGRRRVQLADPDYNSGREARIAGYEQEYVNGTLTLDGLERAISGVLGLALPPLPCGHPATSGYAGGCNDCDAERARARAARSTKGVALAAAVSPAPGVEGLHSSGRPWPEGGGGGEPVVGGQGCIVAFTPTYSLTASAVGHYPAEPREVVELVDGSGQHVSYVDVTPRGRPPLHHVPTQRREQR